MAMPFFLTKRIHPERFDRNFEYPKSSDPDKSCVCFITDANPKYVAYTRLACREMRRFIRKGTPIFVLTNVHGRVEVPEADKVICIAKMIDDFKMHDISRGRFPDIIFAKFLLPLVPDLGSFDRIVCYDPDAIACGHEINDLLYIDFGGHAALACYECTVHLREIKDTLSRCGLADDRETEPFKERFKRNVYCAAGLVVWNARIIRQDKTAYKHLLEYCVRHQDECRFAFPEQHWMTVAFDLRPISLYYDQSFEDDRENYPLVHYAGSKKPILDERCCEAGFLDPTLVTKKCEKNKKIITVAGVELKL